MLQVKITRCTSALCYISFLIHSSCKVSIEANTQSYIYAYLYHAGPTQIDLDCFYSIIVIDCYNKSKTSSNGGAEIKTQGRRETDRMVGRRGGLQSIQRDCETWLQAAHILACWFHFPHSAQRREGERCDAPHRYATQAQIKQAAQVWCNQWCTCLFIFESALYISASFQPISASCRHTCLAGKPIWNVLFAAAVDFSLH